MATVRVYQQSGGTAELPVVVQVYDQAGVTSGVASRVRIYEHEGKSSPNGAKVRVYDQSGEHTEKEPRPYIWIDEMLRPLDRYRWNGSSLDPLSFTKTTTPTDPEDPDEPTEPGVHKMLVGGAISNDASYIAGYNADCGPIRCMREYDNDLKSTFASYSPWAQYNTANKMATAFSFKLSHSTMANGGYDTRIGNFINSWPDDHPGYLLIDNEPDQNKKNLNAATFRAAVEHVHSVFGYRPKPNLKLGIALMQYTFRPALGSGAGLQWLPDVDDLFVDIHAYGATHWGNITQMLSVFTSHMRNRPLWAWGIGETNCQEDPNNANRKANWLTAEAEYCYANGGEFWLPFDTGVGGSDAVRSSAKATAAVKAIATKYDAGPQQGIWTYSATV